MEGIKNTIEGIKRIMNIVCEIDDKEKKRELKNTLKESQIALDNCNETNFREETDRKEKSNGMKISERNEKIEEETYRKEFQEKEKDCKIINRKIKSLSPSKNIKLFPLFKITLLLILKLNNY